MNELMNDKEYRKWVTEREETSFQHVIEEIYWDELAEEAMIIQMHEHGLKY